MLVTYSFLCCTGRVALFVMLSSGVGLILVWRVDVLVL